MEELDGVNSLECKAGHNSVAWSGVHENCCEETLKKYPKPTTSCENVGSQQAISKECVEAVEKLWFQWKGKLSCFNLES